MSHIETEFNSLTITLSFFSHNIFSFILRLCWPAVQLSHDRKTNTTNSYFNLILYIVWNENIWNRITLGKEIERREGWRSMSDIIGYDNNINHMSWGNVSQSDREGARRQRNVKKHKPRGPQGALHTRSIEKYVLKHHWAPPTNQFIDNVLLWM